MTHSNDSQRAHHTRRRFTAAAVVLLASVGSAQQASVVDPHSGGSAASGGLEAGFVGALAIDPDTPATLYAGTSCSGVFKSLDGGDSWSAVNNGLTDPNVTTLAINPTTATATRSMVA